VWVVDRCREPGGLVPAFAAEAAARPTRRHSHSLDDSDRRFLALPGNDDGLGEGDALLTDVDAGPGDELARLALWAGAEGAPQLWRCSIASPPSSTSASGLNDLMNTLVAQLKSLSELAERRAAEVEASHSAVKLDASDIRVLLGINQSLLGELGLSKKRLVNHDVYCT
jgi:hypothetical protein